MLLVVGLGNPGSKYEQTRHNIGFMALDYLASREGFTFADSKWEAKTAKVHLGKSQVVFVKPETYMNNSGRAVGKVCSYYKIPPENVLVVQDDLDLDFGRVKLVVNRGTGGHNGISSIAQCLGSKNFSRIRTGIGRPDAEAEISISNYVLAKFGRSEQSDLDLLLSSVAEAIRLIIDLGAVNAMNFVNRH